jgi:hypothetical protein
MTEPKQKKDDDNKEPTGKDSPPDVPVVPDPEQAEPEEIKLPGKDGPAKVVKQMQQADGSDEAPEADEYQQAVGFDETVTRETSGTDVE